MKEKRYESIAGWIGVLCVFFAYMSVTLEWMTIHNMIYLVLNIIGSIALTIEEYPKKDWQPVVLNVVWLGVALIGVGRALA
ncbi:MAG: hypothetical protein WC895_04800 [Candidatus Shapirobacteria bacterium]|jgi:hypothetical protein